jgi:type II restriction enzyme
VPHSGRIEIVRGGYVMSKDDVRQAWKRTAFMDEASISSRGWLADVLACIETLDREGFSLADIYAFEDRLQALHPENRNVRPKIRQ